MLSGRSPGAFRPEFVHPGCTNIELPLGSEHGLSANEDRQHLDCATWLHKIDYKKSDVLRFHRRGQLGLKALPCQLERSGCEPADSKAVVDAE